MPRPFFITIEGLDGSGKSTQAKLLKAALEENGRSTHLTHEPTYRSNHAKQIKKILTGKAPAPDPLEMQKLYIADRKWHLETDIEPALAKDTSVISDRYYFSTLAYGSLKGLTAELTKLHRDIRKPDLVLFYDTTPETCLKRIDARGEEREFFDKKDKMEKIRAAYKDLVNQHSFAYEIDGSETIENIHRRTITTLREIGIL